jgi:hypothetical protein
LYDELIIVETKDNKQLYPEITKNDWSNALNIKLKKELNDIYYNDSKISDSKPSR